MCTGRRSQEHALQLLMEDNDIRYVWVGETIVVQFPNNSILSIYTSEQPTHMVHVDVRPLLHSCPMMECWLSYTNQIAL